MGESSIEWTDATWNPVRGCTKVSPGCKNCYAETFAERWRGVKGHPYEQGFDLRLVPEKLAEPLSWRKPRRVFVNSMSDLFHEDVPNDYIAAVFGVMAATPQHTYQILTKRAERLPEWFAWVNRDEQPQGEMHVAIGPTLGARDRRRGLPNDYPIDEAICSAEWPLPNVHLGVSVESPEYLSRLDHLMRCPAAVRWVSLEPLIEAVDIRPWLTKDIGGEKFGPRGNLHSLDWVVVGGESGNKARSFNPQWARDVVVQCGNAGVPVFVKQFGSNVVTPIDDPEDEPTIRVRLSSKKGGDPSEWPEDLRVRQWPGVL